MGRVLMGQAFVRFPMPLRAEPVWAALGPFGPGPYGTPRALAGRALMGWALMGWVLVGQALMGPLDAYIMYTEDGFIH